MKWQLLHRIHNGYTDGYTINDKSYIHPNNSYFLRENLWLAISQTHTLNDKSINVIKDIQSELQVSLKQLPDAIIRYTETQNLSESKKDGLEIVAVLLNQYWAIFSIIVHDICHHMISWKTPTYMYLDDNVLASLSTFDHIPSPMLLSSWSQYIVDKDLLYDEIMSLAIEEMVFDMDALLWLHEYIKKWTLADGYIDCSFLIDPFTHSLNSEIYQSHIKSARTFVDWTHTQSQELYEIMNTMWSMENFKRYAALTLLWKWDEYIPDLSLFRDVYATTLESTQYRPYFYPITMSILLLAKALEDNSSGYKELFGMTRRTVPNFCLDFSNNDSLEKFIAMCRQ